jgi:hypothetical protein
MKGGEFYQAKKNKTVGFSPDFYTSFSTARGGDSVTVSLYRFLLKSPPSDSLW